MDEALKDERFSHILKDPRFRKIPKNVRKIKVDKRFKVMFNDEEFNEKSKLDERGRKLNLTSAENLKKLYNVTADSSEDETHVSEEVKNKKKFPKPISLKKNKFPADSEENVKLIKKDKKKSMKKDVSLLGSDASDSSEKDSKECIEKDIHASKSSPKTKNCKKKNTDASQEYSKQQLEIQKIEGQNIKEEEDSDSSEDDEHLSGDERQVKPSHKHLKAKNEKGIDESQENSIGAAESLKKWRQNQVNISSNEEESDTSDEESQESSDSDSEEESDSDGNNSLQDGEFDHHWEEFQKEADDTEEITRRLAVCNMDWDRIRADDLFAVFNSFKPPDGVIHSVKIYPSEYGLKRMEEEKLKGPPELVETTLDPDEEEVEDKKGSKYNQEKLREYQMKRLKYYYAVVECDTPETANHLHSQLNGVEYESSSVRFDLRFISDDTTFDQEPTSVAEKSPDPTEYKPNLFVTTALQQVKVNLTWDETDPQRREILQKAFTDPESIEKDMKNYLASSSGDSEEEENEGEGENEGKIPFKDRIAKYKALLQSLEEEEKKKDEKYEMEITWDPSLKEKTEKIVQEKLDDTNNPFDEMLKKKKEERKLKKQKKKADKNRDGNSSASDDSDSDFSDDKQSKEHNDKKIDELYLISDANKIDEPQEKKNSKGKRNKKEKKEVKSDEFKCDVMDPRFSAIYTSHEYNIDPSDPHFKKTEGNLAIIQEKQNRLKNKDIPSTDERKAKKIRYR